jgi:hypothetical protein
VRLLEPIREPAVQAEPVQAEPVQAEPVQESPPTTKAELRIALQLLRRIYATTDYRLIRRPDGSLILRAEIE